MSVHSPDMKSSLNARVRDFLVIAATSYEESPPHWEGVHPKIHCLRSFSLNLAESCIKVHLQMQMKITVTTPVTQNDDLEQSIHMGADKGYMCQSRLD